MNTTTKEAYQAAKAFMQSWHAAKGKLPLIVGIELYEYFGKLVTIVDSSGQYQVVIEDRFGDRTTVDFEELSMK